MKYYQPDHLFLTTLIVMLGLLFSVDFLHAQPLIISPPPALLNPDSVASNRSQAEALDMFLIEQGLKKNLSIPFLRAAFDDISPQRLAKQYIAPPQGVRAKKNWLKYRQNAMDPIRLEGGKKFWLEHQSYLNTLEKSTGIPAAMIVSILGIETLYGKTMGTFPVRDVLVTLAFDYPPAPNRQGRSEMFTGQLGDLISYCAKSAGMENLSQFKACLTQTSSFAGAMGMPQFMPSSLMKFAKDGDGDGLIDLRNNPLDAMTSIANFFLEHGWLAHQPILLPIAKNANALMAAQKIADGDPLPKWTLEELLTRQIISSIPTHLPANSLALIVDLPTIDEQNNESTLYWVGLKNFEVLTQYNRSFFYAMAVAEFGYTLANSIDPGQINPIPNITKAKFNPGKRRSTSNGRRGHKR